MKTKKARPAPPVPPVAEPSAKPDPYQQVTDLILGHLEKGVVPWRRPWNREVGRPCNLQTGLPYTGVNVVLLGCRYMPSPWWLTFNQVKTRGGFVRPGARGAIIVRYGTWKPKEEAATAPPPPKESAPPANERKGVRFLCTFTVFNASQIEGIAFPEVAKTPSLTENERVAEARRIVASMPRPPVIHEGAGTRALYRPATDEVEMPPLGSFESPEAYHQTLFHELVHATGHASRLNRETLTRHDGFGGKVYSQEELVAEMGAAFLGMEADLVLDRHEQSAAYLKGWLDVLRDGDHRRWIVQSAAQAGKAADFILGRMTVAAPEKEAPASR